MTSFQEPLLDDLFEPLFEVAQEEEASNKGFLTEELCDEIKERVRKIVKYIEDTAIKENDEESVEAFWFGFQQLFGFAPELKTVNEKEVREYKHPVPMNAANLCPEPELLLEAANVLREAYNKDVAQQTRMCKTKKCKERGIRVRQLDAVRKLLARGIGLDYNKEKGVENNVAMVRNSSEANNAISTGIRDWNKETDNVVVWKENHPTNLTAWYLQSEFPRDDTDAIDPLFEVRKVEFDQTLKGVKKEDVPTHVAKFFTDKIDKYTRVVTYSQVSNGTGFRIPDETMRLIMEYAKKKAPRCHIHVDGTMVWGSKSIDVKKNYCHSICSSAHKWFLGPKETAIFWMEETHVQKFCPSIFAYDYKVHVENDWHGMPNNALRFEMIGQRDDVNLIILGCTQIVWDALNQKTKVVEGDEPFAYKRVEHLSDYLVRELKRNGWNIVTPENKDCRWGVIRVEARKKPEPDAISLYDFVYKKQDNKDSNKPATRRIFGSGGDKDFRLCPHIYNTKEDIDYAITLMNRWKRKYEAPKGSA